MALHAGKSLFWYSFHLSISAYFVIFQPNYKIYFIYVLQRGDRERNRERNIKKSNTVI